MMEMKIIRDGKEIKGLFKGEAEKMKEAIIELTTHPDFEGRAEVVLYGTLEEFGILLK